MRVLRLGNRRHRPSRAEAYVAEQACEDDAVAMYETQRRVVAMTESVVTKLAPLPALVENRSGLFGAGRFSAGHFGETIRAIQAELQGRGRDGGTAC